LFTTVFCFLPLGKGFVFYLAFLSIHLLNKITEVLDYFMEIERQTLNMLSKAPAFQANEIIKGAKLITRQMFSCLVFLEFYIWLVFVW